MRRTRCRLPLCRPRAGAPSRHWPTCTPPGCCWRRPCAAMLARRRSDADLKLLWRGVLKGEAIGDDRYRLIRHHTDPLVVRLSGNQHVLFSSMLRHVVPTPPFHGSTRHGPRLRARRASSSPWWRRTIQRAQKRSGASASRRPTSCCWTTSHDEFDGVIRMTHAAPNPWEVRRRCRRPRLRRAARRRRSASWSHVRDQTLELATTVRSLPPPVGRVGRARAPPTGGGCASVQRPRRPGAGNIEEETEPREGRVTFRRFHLGGNGAAHGGAVPSTTSSAAANGVDQQVARTAYLHTNYRRIARVGVELPLRGDGRPHRGRWWHGAACSKVISSSPTRRALFVELRPPQAGTPSGCGRPRAPPPQMAGSCSSGGIESPGGQARRTAGRAATDLLATRRPRTRAAPRRRWRVHPCATTAPPWRAPSAAADPPRRADRAPRAIGRRRHIEHDADPRAGDGGLQLLLGTPDAGEHGTGDVERGEIGATGVRRPARAREVAASPAVRRRAEGVHEEAVRHLAGDLRHQPPDAAR